jgi:hypothetical protein
MDQTAALGDPVTREGNDERSQGAQSLYHTSKQYHAASLLCENHPGGIHSRVAWENGASEAALICLSGAVEAVVGDERSRCPSAIRFIFRGIPRLGCIANRQRTLQNSMQKSKGTPDEGRPLCG